MRFDWDQVLTHVDRDECVFYASAGASKRVKKWIGLLLLIVVLVLGALSTELVSFERLATQYVELKSTVNANRWHSMAVFAGMYFIAVALSLPIAAVLTLTGAALFGWWGVIPIWLGATCGAAVVFLVVRYFLSDWTSQRLGGVLGTVRGEFLASPFRWALSMRLIPLVPFWMANAIPAILGMSLAAFFGSTALGIIPGTLVYVGLGVGFDQVFSRGEVPDLATLSSPTVLGPLLALGALSVLTTLVSRRKQRGVDANH